MAKDRKTKETQEAEDIPNIETLRKENVDLKSRVEELNAKIVELLNALADS